MYYGAEIATRPRGRRVYLREGEIEAGANYKPKKIATGTLDHLYQGRRYDQYLYRGKEYTTALPPKPPTERRSTSGIAGFEEF